MSFEVKLEEEEGRYETRTTMKVIHNGEVIEEHSDGGEPEDQSFYRDWGWVPDAIRQAYELGLKDGQKSQ